MKDAKISFREKLRLKSQGLVCGWFITCFSIWWSSLNKGVSSSKTNSEAPWFSRSRDESHEGHFPVVVC